MNELQSRAGGTPMAGPLRAVSPIAARLRLWNWRRWIAAALWISLLSAHAVAADSCPPLGVAYRVDLLAAEHQVRVNVRFQAESPTAEFQLPVWNGLYQVRDFSQYVLADALPTDVATESTPAPATVRMLNKNTWRVSGGPGCIEFSYLYYADDPGPFGTQLTTEHAFFNWSHILMYRSGHRSEPVEVSFGRVPAHWRLRDGGIFGARSSKDRPWKAEAASYDALADSPVAIGSFEETGFRQDGGRFHVAVDAAESDYDMDKLRTMLRKIVHAEIDWMGDRPFAEYTFLIHLPGGPGAGGMEHAYSAAIEVNEERARQDPIVLAALSAHEFFHLWNVKRIRPQSLEPVHDSSEQYSPALWFSEGVTSMVAEHMLFRAGLLTESQFLARLGADITLLESRPARLTQSLEDSSLDTWLDRYPSYWRPDRSISYYNKGRIVGELFDLQMREVSAGRISVRDLFHSMNENFAKKGRFFTDSDAVRQTAENLTGKSFQDFFSAFVSGVAPLDYDVFLRSVGLCLERRTLSSEGEQRMQQYALRDMPAVTSAQRRRRLEWMRGDSAAVGEENGVNRELGGSAVEHEAAP